MTEPFEYFGDEYFEFSDYLNSLPVKEIIDAQLNMKITFIEPPEFSYYLKVGKNIMNRIKCVQAIKKESDETKHKDILKEYGLNPVDIPKNTNSYIN